MSMKDDDFDESVLDDEAAFKKRFRRIERPKFLGPAKGVKSRITIYLDADIVEHFKKTSGDKSVGYQTLINQALRERIDAPRPSDDPIEKLLKDKKALRRLKASLKGV